LDAYELAITACARAVAGRPGAGAARARLLAMQRGDGSLLGVGSITGSGPTDLRIETTSFAVLAWSATADKGRGNPDAAVPSAAPSAVSSAVSSAAQRAVRFLETQRQGNGTFGGTQATVMALQALTAYLGANTPTIEPGTLKVFLGDQELYALQLQGTEKRAIAIDHLGRHLAVGDNKVRLELSGGNAFPFSMALTYRADQPDSSPDCALDLNTWLSEKVLPEGGTTALHAVVRNKGKQPVANPMVLVGLPAGLHCDTKVLDDLKKSEAIAAWELIDNDIALYLRGLQAGETRDIVIDLVGLIPGVSKGAASRAYLYYAARHKTWAPPIQVEVTVGR
jgi:hypothetical protein